MNRLPLALAAGTWFAGTLLTAAPVFQLPTANRFLFEPGMAARFYAPTPGKSWPSGMFGCVRSAGTRFHEGIDILSLQQDKKGEPLDPILATAKGTVAYINRHPGLSNYGKYLLLQHRIEGLEIYSLYAHLSQILPGLRPGQTVLAGEQIGVMGRTANTRSPITKDRAHLHFELAFLLNDRFAAWLGKTIPGSQNDHGKWNGQNFVGIDPSRIFLAQDQQGPNFRLLLALRHETEICRVLVLKRSFPWIERYPQLVQTNALCDREGVAGFELALKFNGLPFLAIPRAPSEAEGLSNGHLLSVNEAECQAHPCQQLLARRRDRWELTAQARRLLSLLTY